MPFGQASGPPASGRQVADLLRLLQEAGHVGFRDARGPLGFTQRQGSGKFTVTEAAAFIEQLEEAATVADARSPRRAPVVRARRSPLQHVPSEDLAAELTGRGWVVTAP